MVSVGPVPASRGWRPAKPRRALTDAGLKVGYNDPVFHDEVPVDVVVTADWTADPMRPGDTVVLTLSKGPDLVEVPNVVTGQTIAQARAAARGARLLRRHECAAVPRRCAVIAGVQSPAAGEKLKRGSEITVNFR